MRPILTVNLTALRNNYILLKSLHAKYNIASVVKANAYGLGVSGVSLALWEAGCREFFVATLDEGVELRAILPNAKIGVFQGLFAGEEKEYTLNNLLPVLNSVEQVRRFLAYKSWNSENPMIMHIDTGMARLGLSQTELSAIAASMETPEKKIIMSHLACANTPDHPKNAEQLARFKEDLQCFPNAKASLSNSAGLFLPHEFHFDLARTGCALYGINPLDKNNKDSENAVENVVTLSAPIVQIRSLDRDENIGYGATVAAPAGSRIAIVGMGYADGYSRLLGNKGFAYINEHKAPVIGRVSMDLIALDISKISEENLKNVNKAEFINDKQTVDDIARECNTIGYEIFTSIGARVKREYV